MHDDDFSGSEKLLRDNDAAQCIGHSTTGVADDMSIAFFEA
jgi:hypothetical protein